MCGEALRSSAARWYAPEMTACSLIPGHVGDARAVRGILGIELPLVLLDELPWIAARQIHHPEFIDGVEYQLRSRRIDRSGSHCANRERLVGDAVLVVDERTKLLLHFRGKRNLSWLLRCERNLLERAVHRDHHRATIWRELETRT